MEDYKANKERKKRITYLRKVMSSRSKRRAIIELEADDY